MNQAKSALHSLMRSTRRVVIRTVVGATVAVGTLEITTELPSKGRSSWFYHYMADDVGTPLMRRFLGPETAHDMAINIAKAGLTPLYRPNAAEQRVSLQQKLVFDKTSDSDVNNNIKIKTLKADNPIGMAAGLDKHGEIIQPLLDLGFGSVEIGTVTPRPQPGNPRPRMFRLTADRAIINRYGFNSVGAAAVQQNVLKYYQDRFVAQQKQQAAQTQPSSWWLQALYTIYPKAFTTTATTSAGLLGINIGKNKTSTTPQQVIQDYVHCIETLGPLADYLVINVSSPNTAGLRDAWQQDVSNLRNLLQACITARNQLAASTMTNASLSSLPPLFVKLAPDLSNDELRAIVQVCLGDVDDDSSATRTPLVDGIVVTNTTTARPGDLLSWQHRHESGGLSGEPLKDVSTQCIAKVYALTQGTVPIIGVGGVSSGADAYEKLRAGASLVQVYSAMVYHGPGVISRMRQELATVIRQNGQRSLDQVVGSDHPEIVYTNHFTSKSVLPPVSTSTSSSSSSSTTSRSTSTTENDDDSNDASSQESSVPQTNEKDGTDPRETKKDEIHVITEAGW